MITKTDADLHHDMALAREAADLVREGGFTAELWETLALARTQAGLLRSEVDRLNGLIRQKRPLFVGGLFLDALFTVRKHHGFRARALHEALLRGEMPLDAERAEIIQALWIGSDEFRLPFAAELEDLAATADRILARRRPTSADADSVDAIGELDSELLDDLRQALELHEAFAKASPGVDLWVCLALTLENREEAARTARRLLEEPVSKGLDSGMVRFIQRARHHRDAHRDTAAALRLYVRCLPIGDYSPDTLDLAFAFLLGTDRGREMVRPWLEDPRRCAREAALRFEGIIGKAQKYQFAIRSTTAA